MTHVVDPVYDVFIPEQALDTSRRMRSFLGRNGFNASIIIIICAYLYIGFTVMTRNDIMSLDININSCYWRFVRESLQSFSPGMVQINVRMSNKHQIEIIFQLSTALFQNNVFQRCFVVLEARAFI